MNTNFRQVLVSATDAATCYCESKRMSKNIVLVNKFNYTFDKDLIIVYLRNWNGDNVQISGLGASSAVKTSSLARLTRTAW